MRKIFLDLVAIIVIVPTSLVAGVWSLFAVVVIPSALLGDPGFTIATGVYLLFLLIPGWFGIYTLWKLYTYFLNDWPIERSQSWCGLASGTAVSLFMIFASGGTVYFSIFLGWPVIATLIFSAMLQRAHRII